MRGHHRWAVSAVLLGTVVLSGCQTLRELTALQRVDFALDRVRNLRLAGVELDGIRSVSDVGGLDLARIAAAVASGDLPLEMDVLVDALNPADNPTQARLVRMDWTLLLENRETVSGSLANAVVLEPGVTTSIPISVGLDLVDFFEGSSRDLVDLVLSLAGEGGSTKNVALRALPTIDTALGPIQYPTPITVVSGEVGGP